MTSIGHPCNFQQLSRLGSVTARHSSSRRQPNFAALNRGRHLYSAGRPPRWALVCKWEIHATRLNVLNSSTLRSNFSKKCQGGDFEICGVIDEVHHGESEYEVKTGTGSSFRRHFGEKPIFWVFLGPISPLLWGLRGRYLGP